MKWVCPRIRLTASGFRIGIRSSFIGSLRAHSRAATADRPSRHVAPARTTPTSLLPPSVLSIVTSRRLHHHRAAGDVQYDARDPRGLLGGEVEGGARHIFRCPEPLEGMGVDEPLLLCRRDP